MNFVNGEIITSLIPVEVNVLLIATIMEMTRMVDKSSVIAKIKLEKILLMEWLKEPVAVIAIRKIPTIQISVVSLLITIKPIIKRINKTYIQCSAANSTPMTLPP